MPPKKTQNKETKVKTEEKGKNIPAEEKSGKSEKAHSKADENDAKAGHTQAKLAEVEPTIEQRWNQLGALSSEEFQLEDKLAELKKQEKDINADLEKVRNKITALRKIAAGQPVQKELPIDKKGKKDDRQHMDQSSYKTAEELRRHPQHA